MTVHDRFAFMERLYDAHVAIAKVKDPKRCLPVDIQESVVAASDMINQRLNENLRLLYDEGALILATAGFEQSGAQ